MEILKLIGYSRILEFIDNFTCQLSFFYVVGFIKTDDRVDIFCEDQICSIYSYFYIKQNKI